MGLKFQGKGFNIYLSIVEIKTGVSANYLSGYTGSKKSDPLLFWFHYEFISIQVPDEHSEAVIA